MTVTQMCHDTAARVLAALALGCDKAPVGVGVSLGSDPDREVSVEYLHLSRWGYSLQDAISCAPHY